MVYVTVLRVLNWCCTSVCVHRIQLHVHMCVCILCRYTYYCRHGVCTNTCLHTLYIHCMCNVRVHVPAFWSIAHQPGGGASIATHPLSHELHPSWAANKRQKEQSSSIDGFCGKKITFSDSDWFMLNIWAAVLDLHKYNILYMSTAVTWPVCWLWYIVHAMFIHCAVF